MKIKATGKCPCRYCGFIMDERSAFWMDDEVFCDEDCAAYWEDRDEIAGCDSEEEWLIDGVGFADPGGNSALRAATRNNPRNLPCPTCGEPNRLTPLDRRAGYQCDACADLAERGGY